MLHLDHISCPDTETPVNQSSAVQTPRPQSINHQLSRHRDPSQSIIIHCWACCAPAAVDPTMRTAWVCDNVAPNPKAQVLLSMTALEWCSLHEFDIYPDSCTQPCLHSACLALFCSCSRISDCLIKMSRLPLTRAGT